MSTGCRDCRAGFDHCHGTMIVHSLSRPECTEPDCAVPELFTHAFVIDCDVVGCECAQADGEAGWSAHRVGA
ncbi:MULTISPECIES: hypothetical protein [Mycobacterium]|uniref:Uncharacterized protein n=1 Tax=Mycobacterium kiyosense TaxID=2871094 RepID=A0A9P3Q7P5_9MYCO|nr:MULTISPECIES: hypothetical protein [Mycobacterium]BDB45736.1 hypothetical protein IWGMT90018_61820 [Mycobacterium kiyosense]BDE11346.1 hypothetical protein MKCMC460_02060 [Mycobacterium sp. 20KCMC460]GLB85636.1 hypothetical protein SRL2020028_48920 [Mycobacterium kiyosense]GLB92365.1 hypothetical protein SRL2020130_51820 [Mycobacterium kiyosense]GLB98474.1 hypothetical protein SRL2020226_52500 [Mycobacterium kiyosense]